MGTNPKCVFGNWRCITYDTLLRDEITWKTGFVNNPIVQGAKHPEQATTYFMVVCSWPISEILFDSAQYRVTREHRSELLMFIFNRGYGIPPFLSMRLSGRASTNAAKHDFFLKNLTTIQLDYTDAPLRDSKCLWLRKLQWVAESTSQIASNPYWIVVFLSLALHDGCST